MELARGLRGQSHLLSRETAIWLVIGILLGVFSRGAKSDSSAAGILFGIWMLLSIALLLESYIFR